MLAQEIDVDKAVEATFKVAESKIKGFDEFGTYAPIYLAPTSNTKETVELYTKEGHNIESALVIGSQGSFAHELALNGVKKIDCFDKNILEYLYYALFDAAICQIDFDDFLFNFTSKKCVGMKIQKFEHILSNWLFYDVLDAMDAKAADYWSRIFESGKKADLIASN